MRQMAEQMAKRNGTPRWNRVIGFCWLVLFGLSVGVVILYGFSISGRHLQFVTVGLLVAGASLGCGALFGFLFGIPRMVALGKARETIPADDVDSWKPSTNLAEISDWLTKLLLGAGLVQLTNLGGPAGALIRSIARGLDNPSSTSSSGPAMVAAGTIVVLFTILGFVMGYVLTTLWYSNALASLFRDALAEEAALADQAGGDDVNPASDSPGPRGTIPAEGVAA
jgi:hypothetical protein